MNGLSNVVYAVAASNSVIRTLSQVFPPPITVPDIAQRVAGNLKTVAHLRFRSRILRFRIGTFCFGVRNRRCNIAYFRFKRDSEFQFRLVEATWCHGALYRHCQTEPAANESSRPRLPRSGSVHRRGLVVCKQWPQTGIADRNVSASWSSELTDESLGRPKKTRGMASL